MANNIRLSELILYIHEGNYIAEARDSGGDRLPEKVKATGLAQLAKKVLEQGWEIDSSRINYSTENSPYNPRKDTYKDEVKGMEIKQFHEWYFKHKSLANTSNIAPKN